MSICVTCCVTLISLSVQLVLIFMFNCGSTTCQPLTPKVYTPLKSHCTPFMLNNDKFDSFCYLLLPSHAKRDISPHNN